MKTEGNDPGNYKQLLLRCYTLLTFRFLVCSFPGLVNTALN